MAFCICGPPPSSPWSLQSKSSSSSSSSLGGAAATGGGTSSPGGDAAAKSPYAAADPHATPAAYASSSGSGTLDHVRSYALRTSAEHARPRPEGAGAGVVDPSRGDNGFVATNGGLGFTPSTTIHIDLQGSAGGGHVTSTTLGEDRWPGQR